MKVFVSNKHLGDMTIEEKATAILALSQEDLEVLSDEEVIAYAFILKVVAASLEASLEAQQTRLKALTGKAKEALSCISAQAYPLGIDATMIGGARTVFSQVTKEGIEQASDDLSIRELLNRFPHLEQFCTIKIPKKAAERELFNEPINEGLFIRTNETEVKASSSARALREFEWDDPADGVVGEAAIEAVR